jgi:hypothetical protein
MLHRRILFLGLFFIAILGFLTVSAGVLAGTDQQSDTAQPSPTPDPLVSIGDEVCLSCHGRPGPTLVLENGDVLDLYVPEQDHQRSVHGSLGYACVQCHRTVGNYPHPPFQAKDLRDVSLQLYQVCQRCHQQQYSLAQDSVHAIALAEGQREAAVCTDCHTAHSVRRLNEPGTRDLTPDARVWIPQTCSQCHYQIFMKYQASVHGSALIGEGNLDVPTCIDCHGVHNIEDPTTATFRLRSPQMCARCHTDEQRMAKYGISTQVLETYVADFHGTTVTLFHKMTPDAETNKPVCYDCHGVHDILRADDPEKGIQVRENLLARCQVCHPDATINFSTSWLSHYIPSPERHPIVYYVNLFYKFFIPTVLGGMALLVVLDLNKLASRRIWRRTRKTTPEERVQEPEPEEASPSVEASQGEDEASEQEVGSKDEAVPPPDEEDSGPAQEANHD